MAFDLYTYRYFFHVGLKEFDKKYTNFCSIVRIEYVYLNLYFLTKFQTRLYTFTQGYFGNHLLDVQKECCFFYVYMPED